MGIGGLGNYSSKITGSFLLTAADWWIKDLCKYGVLPKERRYPYFIDHHGETTAEGKIT
jgi:hypothetical protein